jgi:hypothetical protein
VALPKYTTLPEGLQTLFYKRKLAITTVAKAFSKSRNNTYKLLSNPYDLRVRQLVILAGLLSVNYWDLFRLVYCRESVDGDFIGGDLSSLINLEQDKKGD